MSEHYDQLMLDVFTTALEGGIGYWSECSRYHRETDGEPDTRGFRAHIYDVEDTAIEPEGMFYIIDRTVIARGYRLACGDWRGKVAWSSEKPPIVVHEDGWDFDAGDADVIVQLGLFGEVVYG